MKDVRIDNRQRWRIRHWRTIVSCYSRSPWFELYCRELELLYSEPCDFLMEWNLKCLAWSISKLGLHPRIEKACPEAGEPDLEDLRTKSRHTDQEGDNETLRYRQVFEERTGFIAGLSILDLLFCEGRNALSFLAGTSGRA